MKKLAILAAGLAMWGFATAASAQTFYTDSANFMSEVAPGHYLEQFDGWTHGNPLMNQPTWAAPGANGFGWTASAAGGLWSNPGALSTTSANTPITITFTGNPVHAFGGDFTNTDIDGNPIPGNVGFLVASGDFFETFSPAFIGFTSASPIVSVTLSSQGILLNNWIQADNLVTGTLIPEPATALVAGLGAMGLLLRRRK